MTINPTRNRTLMDRIKWIEDQLGLSVLTPTVKNAVVNEGFIQFTDDNGTIRIQIGFNSPSSYEICFWDAAGLPLGCMSSPAGGGGMPPGGWIEDTLTVNSNTVLTSTDQNIFVNTATAAGATQMTLPGTHVAGKVYSIIDIGGQAETKNITIISADGDTIKGGASYVLDINNEGVTVISDGTNWHPK